MSTAVRPPGELPRLRQAVLAARDLDAVAGELGAAFDLGEPFRDETVGAFGLRNLVFPLGDTFLEVVSPVREDTAAGRLLDRREADVCGYMLMFQVPDLEPARARAAGEGVREVFAVELEDISEVHLHPADMHGAIVSLTAPRPPAAWRWGGPGWAERTGPAELAGATVAVAEADEVRERWGHVVGSLPGVRVEADPAEPGLVEVTLRGPQRRLRLDAVELISLPELTEDAP